VADVAVSARRHGWEDRTVPHNATARTLAAVRALGAEHLFVSSDAGLTGELNQTDTLAIAAKALRAAGSSERDLALMFKDNPAYFVKLPRSSAAESAPR
jgi:hypothetical protein